MHVDVHVCCDARMLTGCQSIDGTPSPLGVSQSGTVSLRGKVPVSCFSNRLVCLPSIRDRVGSCCVVFRVRCLYAVPLSDVVLTIIFSKSHQRRRSFVRLCIC